MHLERGEGQTTSLGLEGSRDEKVLDGILARRFSKVGRMTRLPLDNQALQKREAAEISSKVATH